MDRRADGRCTFLSKRHDDQAAELLERVGAPTIAKIKEAFTRGAAVPRRRGDAVRDPPLDRLELHAEVAQSVDR